MVKPWKKEFLLAEIARVLSKQQALLTRLHEEFQALDSEKIRARLKLAEAVANATKEQIQTFRQNQG